MREIMISLLITAFGFFVAVIEGKAQEPDHCGLFPVNLNGKCGFINNYGEIVIKPTYDSVDSFYDGVARINSQQKCFFIDGENHKLINVNNGEVGVFCEGLAVIRVNQLCGFINKSGAVEIPIQFDQAKPFEEGLAAVMIDDRWGYIDKSGKTSHCHAILPRRFLPPGFGGIPMLEWEIRLYQPIWRGDAGPQL